MLTYLLIAIGILVAITLYIIWNDAKRRRTEEKRRQNKRERSGRIEPRVYTRPRPKTEPIKTVEPKSSDKPHTTQKPSDTKPTPPRPIVSEEKKEITPSQPSPQKESKPLHTSVQETPALHRQRFRWQTKIPQSLPFPRIAMPAPSEADNVELPEGDYPPFSHQRLIDMGLSDTEAKEFVQELIPQIEEQIPQIEAALEKEDFQALERLTHSIKGSSTNVGTGGVSDVLVEYNIYLKTGNDTAIAARYLEILKTYLAKLKKHYTD